MTHHTIQSLGAWAWRASWQAALLAFLVAAILALFRKKLSPACRFWLWSIVLIRLAIPSIIDIPWWQYFRGVDKPHQPKPAIIAQTPPQRRAQQPTPQIIPTPQAPEVKIIPTAPRETAPPRAEIPTRTSPSQIWATTLKTLPYLWLTGALIIAIRITRATLQLSRAVNQMPIIDEPHTQSLLRQCCRDLRIRRIPQLRNLPTPAGPALVGFLRPRILLPMQTLAYLGQDELRLVLLHELAHVKRRDVLINWLATAIATLHWPNPAAWLVLWRMRTERELACDEIVLRTSQPAPSQPTTGHTYAHTILKLLESLSEESAPRAPRALAPAVGILEPNRKSQIQRRLLMITRFDTRMRRWSLLGTSLALILAAAALTGVVSAQDKDQKQDPSTTDPANRAQPAAQSRQPNPPGDEGSDAAQSQRTQTRPRRSPIDEEMGLPPGAGAGSRDATNALIQKFEKIKALNPNLPALSPQASQHFFEYLRSPATHTPDNIRQQLWNNLEKELIYVPGQQTPVNQKAIEQKFLASAQALDAWIAAANNAGLGQDPRLRQHAASTVSFTSVAHVDDPATTKAREKLKKTVKVAFNNQSLGDVIDFLRDVSGVDMVVDWRGLEASGITRDTTVELRLNEPTTIDHILDLALRNATNGLVIHHFDRGVLMVVLAEQRNSQMVTKAYDVADLAPIQIPGDQTAPAQPGAYGGGGGGYPRGHPGFADANQIAQLRALIMQTVEPSSWQESGGTGTIGAFGSKLIIKNTEPIHKEVTDLLSMLREKPPTKPTERKAQQ